MTVRASPAGPDPETWARLLPLLREINDLKRIRAPGIGPSVAAAWFRDAAAHAFHASPGDDPGRRRRRALRVTADAVAATRTGAMTAADLRAGGLDAAAAADVFRRALEERRGALDPVLFEALAASLGDAPEASPGAPARERGDASPDDDWIERLVGQPRAGATAPGQPRIVLEPVESCAEHCLVTAVYAVLLAPSFGAAADAAFEIGLAHHVHNAYLPDAGFAGEALVGDALEGLVATLRRTVLGRMEGAAAERVAALLAEIDGVDTPLARTFHAADTVDRVLQMDYFARCNRFTLDTALVDMELVHAGPVQSFQLAQLANAGLVRS